MKDDRRESSSRIMPTLRGMSNPEGGGAELETALTMIREHVSAEPEVVLILGSGLGDLAESVENRTAIDTSEIPRYPRSTVAGHRGRLLFGTLEGRRVMSVQGRAHLYEGHTPRSVTFPVRLGRALGARHLFVTNAAGGIHPDLRPGTLMLISDHINMAMRPLDFHESRGPFPLRHAHPYDPAWLDRAEKVALRNGIRTRRGVYLWSLGPSYETKAEIHAFRRLGADAVGMSTVPEVMQAAALGMKVLGISSITNPAAGLSAGPLSHKEVLRVGNSLRRELETVIRGILAELF